MSPSVDFVQKAELDFMSLPEEDKFKFLNLFKKLRFTCVQFSNDISIDNVKHLNQFIHETDSQFLQLFSDYIWFPIIAKLEDAEVRSEIKCEILRCVCKFLKKVKVEVYVLFMKVLVTVLEILKPGVDAESSNAISEELKLSSLEVFNLLFKGTTLEVSKKVFVKEHLAKLSAMIFCCQQYATTEKFIALRVQALETTLTFVELQEEYKSKVFRRQVGDLAMFMFAGVMTCCSKLCNTNEIINHKIVLLAVQIWGRMIGLIMDESLIPKNCPTVSVYKLNSKSEHLSGSMTDPETPEEMMKIVQTQTRDMKWFKAIDFKLEPGIGLIVHLQQHENWKIRKQLAIEIDHILINSSRLLPSSIGHLLDALIVLSQDDHIEISKISKVALDKFSTKCQINNERKIIEIIEEFFYLLLTSLPRILHDVNLNLKEKKLILLSGYLDILGSKLLSKIINSAQHMKRLLRCLYIAVQLEINHISLLEEISIRDINEESTINSSVWKQMKYCHTEKCQKCIEDICKKLIAYADRKIIIHYLLDEFNSNFQFRKEITLLFHYIFKDKPGAFSINENILRDVITSLMEPSLWNPPLSVGRGAAKTRQEAQDNVVQVCLLNESIASIANALGKDIFSPLLLHCLYPLLESAGSTVFAISVAGLQSLNSVANLYGGGVGDLVANNVDYLSYHVTLNLRSVQNNPSVLSVLSVIMKHSSINVLPSLFDIVSDVLVQSCDNFQEVNSRAFLQVFHTFVSCLLEWLKLDVKLDHPDQASKHLSVFEELIEYHKATQKSKMWMSDGENMDKDYTSDCEDPPMQPEEQITKPDYVDFVVQILNRTLNFLPSKDPPKQILVLQILEKGILILSQWPDMVLPIVHKIWSPLAGRFDPKSNPLIIHRAFSLLVVLGKVAKDFIRARTMKDVMPSLCKVLKKSSETSHKEKADGAYILSLQYKMQLAILNGIGIFCKNLDVDEKQIETILEAIDLYLNKFQPHSLQDACKKSYLELARKDPSSVWIHLISLSANNIDLPSPFPELQTFKINGRLLENEKYCENVNVLLETLERL